MTQVDEERDARWLWREKLEFYLAEEAKASDPAQRFQLRKAIEEAHARLAELAAIAHPRDATAERSADSQQPSADGGRTTGRAGRRRWLMPIYAVVVALVVGVAVYLPRFLEDRGQVGERVPKAVHPGSSDEARYVPQKAEPEGPPGVNERANQSRETGDGPSGPDTKQERTSNAQEAEHGGAIRLYPDHVIDVRAFLTQY